MNLEFNKMSEEVKKQEELLKAVHDLKSAVDKSKEDKLDSDNVMKEQLNKQAEDMIVMQRTIDVQDTKLATLEESKDVKLDLKPIFDSGSVGKSLAAMYSIDMTGVKHPEVAKMFYTPRTEFKGNRIVREKSYDGLDDLMRLQDIVHFMGVAKTLKEDIRYTEAVRSLKAFDMLQQEINYNSDLAKALDTVDSSEFIPTQFSARLLDDVRLELKVAGLFQRLALPSSPYTNPIRGQRQVAYLIGEPTTDTASKVPTSDPVSANVTFTAKTLAVRNLFSDMFAEDSVIPVLPWVMSELKQAMVDAQEDAVINGDTSTTHQHSDVTAANDRRKAWDGLLKLSGGSSGNAAVDISTLSVANLRSIRKKMGRFGANSAKLAYVTSVSGYVQMLSLDEVETIDKFGPMATIQAGELAKLDGSPVIVSEFVRNDLTTAGIYDGATVTDTEVFLVHTPSFLFGDVGAAKAESARDIESLQTVVVTSARTSFKEIHTPGSGEETVGLGYSLTS